MSTLVQMRFYSLNPYLNRGYSFWWAHGSTFQLL